MLVDLILDRKDGARYSPSKFQYEVKEYCKTFRSCIPVYKALLCSSEEKVKDELCKYIDEEWYGNPLIKGYIRSVSWK